MNDTVDTFIDRTRELRSRTARGDVSPAADSGGHAILILIAHPEHERLGSRTRLEEESSVEIGRDPGCGIAFPEVLSLSRVHAHVHFGNDAVVVEDLGSTNGTFVNDHRVDGPLALSSGDRIQFGALHFKFFRGEDVEAAYHEAIHQLVMQDGLTEVGNRRRFDEELAREFARAVRHDRPLALVLFDIDRFKEINDALGHLCGDYVLKRLAKICGQRLRPEQVFARIGGDEFAIVSPETGIGGAEILAEKLRAAVSNHRFETDLVPDSFQVTCSFGCAEMSRSMRSEPQLIEAADRALYAAKKAGRNRVDSA